MTKDIYFDTTFILDSSLSSEQVSFLRQSFQEYSVIPVVSERLEILQKRRDALPSDDNRIRLALASPHQGTEFDWFDSASYLRGEGMQTLYINFEQLEAMRGCDIDTGEVAEVFSPALTIWGHEISGHAADPLLHLAQNRLMGSPKIQEISKQFDAATEAEKPTYISDVKMLRLNTLKAVVDEHKTEEMSLIYGDIIEKRGVDIADRVRMEKADEGLTLRQYYFNGVLFSAEQMMQRSGVPEASHHAILTQKLVDMGVNLTELEGMHIEGLSELMDQKNCAALPRVIASELGDEVAPSSSQRRGSVR